jgi:hypothetical protein
MTGADIIPILEKTGGNLAQDVLRRYTGSCHLVHRYLHERGLAQIVLVGRRKYWKLTHSLSETIAALSHCTEEAHKKRGPRSGTAAQRMLARHWMVVHDPARRFSTTARFGVYELRGDIGASWLVPGMILQHEISGTRLYYDRDGLHIIEEL